LSAAAISNEIGTAVRLEARARLRLLDLPHLRGSSSNTHTHRNADAGKCVVAMSRMFGERAN
jgi:hypothetical protein